MKSVVIAGAVIALLGLIAFALPSFNTEDTHDVVKFGDLKVQAKTEQPHTIPPILSEGAIVLGVILIGAGVVMNRRAN
jgi:drug/metabolite transporter (DMT)-like permease